jgi:hypothetical protein
VPNVKKIRGLNLPDSYGPAQACSGRALPFNMQTETQGIISVVVLYLRNMSLCVTTGSDGRKQSVSIQPSRSADISFLSQRRTLAIIVWLDSSPCYHINLSFKFTASLFSEFVIL